MIACDPVLTIPGAYVSALVVLVQLLRGIENQGLKTMVGAALYQQAWETISSGIV